MLFISNMSNFFKNILNKADKLEDDILGPDFPYYKFVKSPKELGMSSNGDMDSLTKDIGGIISYVQILISGTGNANKLDSRTPLGNQFFLRTGGKCKDYKSKRIVDRSLYVNNIPSSKIPLISNLSGMKFNEFRGLVPGIMHNMYAINPVKMFGAFTQGSQPLCAEVTLPQYDENGRKTMKSGYVPITDLLDLVNNDEIPNNTINQNMKNALEKEGFQNLCNNCKIYNVEEQNNILKESIKKNMKIKKTDSFTNIYFTSIAFLIMYIFYKYYTKK
jgi:hypothetical protein